jgi:predicted transcriptional regulator
MTAKETIIEMVKQMPDDATVPDIITKLYVRQQIDERLREVAAGEWVEHEEALKSLAKWHA